MKGPNYREPCIINWKKVVDCIKAGVAECQIRWSSKENVEPVVLNVWSASLMYHVFGTELINSRRSSVLGILLKIQF